MVRRRVPSRDDEPEEMEDIPEEGSHEDPGDMQVQGKAAAPGNTRVTGQHGETPVDRHMFIERTPFRDTVTALLPYNGVNSIQLNNNAVATKVGQFMFRLNSIYDVGSTTAYAADPVAGADAADVTVNTPMFRSYYANFYQYWTVIGAKYKLEYRWLTSNGLNHHVEAYIYETGLQQAPISNIAGNALIPYQYRRHHRNMKHYQRLTACKTLAAHGHISPEEWEYKELYTGYYKPGSVNHEVVEDELSQTWHKMTEVPPTPEKCQLIVQVADDNTDATAGAYNIDIRLSIEYAVQFKDLKVQYQYLVTDTSIPALANVCAQTN